MDKYEKDHARQVDDIIEEMLTFEETVIKTMGKNVVITLTASTPKDSGFAAANWRADRTRSRAIPVPNKHEGGVTTSQATQAKSIRDLDRYKLEHGSVVVSNNVPYIQSLERGHSAQAKSGFVGPAVAKAIVATESKLKK